MYGYYKEKLHVNHLWELKGSKVGSAVHLTDLYLVDSEINFVDNAIQMSDSTTILSNL